MVNPENANRIEGGKRFRCYPEGQNWKKPLVSVIMAVYNGNATVQETITSVTGQTHPNFEYIVIDGGSTDGTVETLRKFDEFIDYWSSQSDEGVYDALNKGIGIARGEWLYFIGADDRLKDADVLKRVFSNIPSTKMIYANVYSELHDMIYYGKFNKLKLTIYNICHQAAFYHKGLFEQFGNFNTKYKMFSDWDFNIKCFSDSSTAPHYMDTIVAYYSSTGMSSINSDIVFEKDRPTIIKEYFGYTYYLYLRVAKLYSRTHHLLHRLRHVSIGH